MNPGTKSNKSVALVSKCTQRRSFTVPYEPKTILMSLSIGIPRRSTKIDVVFIGSYLHLVFGICKFSYTIFFIFSNNSNSFENAITTETFFPFIAPAHQIFSICYGVRLRVFCFLCADMYASYRFFEEEKKQFDYMSVLFCCNIFGNTICVCV